MLAVLAPVRFVQNDEVEGQSRERRVSAGVPGLDRCVDDRPARAACRALKQAIGFAVPDIADAIKRVRVAGDQIVGHLESERPILRDYERGQLTGENDFGEEVVEDSTFPAARRDSTNNLSPGVTGVTAVTSALLSSVW